LQSGKPELVFIAFAALFLVVWALVYATGPAIRSLGRLASRFAARSKPGSRVERFRDYVPVIAIIAAGVLVSAWAGDAFLDLAGLVQSKSTFLQNIDSRVHQMAIDERSRAATPFFLALTTIGGPAGVGVICGIVGIILAVKQRWNWLTYLAVAAGGGALLNVALKQYFARARPDAAEMLRRANGYSFPSGHAMGSAVAFGALAYLASRSLKTGAARSAVVAAAITLVCGVALSRVYLGVHWISDVAAGVAIGFVWVTATTSAYEVLRRVRLLRAAARSS
jgi:membrane-associated phospholipid phosphatase